MASTYVTLATLSDDQLLAEVTRLASCECQAIADLIASLAVVDARQLYLREGYSSLFSWCTGALGLSEDAAYFRIEAARAARRFPMLFERLATGAITLTGVKLLAPHLTEANHKALIDAVRRRSKREIEQMLVRLHPRPDVPALVRKLPTRQVPLNMPAPSLIGGSSLLPASLGSPTPAPTAERASSAPAPDASGRDSSDWSRAVSTPAPVASGSPSAPAPGAGDRASAVSPDTATAAMFETAPGGPPVSRPQRSVIAPLAPERYKVQMTISAETHERLCQAQALLRHAVPNGDLATIFDRALVVLVEQLERRKWGATKERARATKSDGGESATAHGRSRSPRKRASACPSAAAAIASRADHSGEGLADSVDSVAVLEQVPERGPSVAAARAGGSGDAPADSVASAATMEQVPERPSPLAPSPAGGSGDLPVGSVISVAAMEQVPERVPPAVEPAAGARQEPLRVRANAAKRSPRRIPASVRRAVWRRDGGRCSYVSPGGHRCESKSRLEFHHSVPYADGGRAVEGSVTLLCAAHHARETARWFGKQPSPP